MIPFVKKLNNIFSRNSSNADRETLFHQLTFSVPSKKHILKETQVTSLSMLPAYPSRLYDYEYNGNVKQLDRVALYEQNSSFGPFGSKVALQFANIYLRSNTSEKDAKEYFNLLSEQTPNALPWVVS
jgi:hypothetical protein